MVKFVMGFETFTLLRTMSIYTTFNLAIYQLQSGIFTIRQFQPGVTVQMYLLYKVIHLLYSCGRVFAKSTSCHGLFALRR